MVLPRPARGAGTLIPSAQRLVWAAKQALGKAALGALFEKTDGNRPRKVRGVVTPALVGSRLETNRKKKKKTPRWPLELLRGSQAPR